MAQINIAYYRVSTKKQEVSGLGLDSQKSLVFGFLRKEPDYEFVETESGKKSGRVELQKAIELTKKTGGRLYIAKLDRLSRNVHFISGLMEAKIDFICCDNPSATPFTLHILASVAEFEAKMISERTKQGLKAKVDREIAAGNINFKLGRKTPITEEEKNEIRKNRRRIADKNPNYIVASNIIKSKFESGLSILNICKELNLFKIKTLNDSLIWTPMQVHRIINRLKSKEETKNLV